MAACTTKIGVQIADVSVVKTNVNAAVVVRAAHHPMCSGQLLPRHQGRSYERAATACSGLSSDHSAPRLWRSESTDGASFRRGAASASDLPAAAWAALVLARTVA